MRRQSSTNLRSVSGVVCTFVTLVFMYYIGGIVFYRVCESLDVESLPSHWFTIYNALYQFFGLGLSIYILLLIFCIFAPLIWIFLGRTRSDRV